MTLHEAVKAAQELKNSGKAIRVVDLFTVKPVDRETLIKSANATQGRVLVVEDHYYEGGLGEAVMAALADQANIRVAHLAVPEVARSGKPAELLHKYGIDAAAIVSAVEKLVGNS